MRFLRLSNMQIINLENVTRVEIYQSHEIRYVTINFLDGKTYRCTEEESEVFMPVIDRLAEKPAGSTDS